MANGKNDIIKASHCLWRHFGNTCFGEQRLEANKRIKVFTWHDGDGHKTKDFETTALTAAITKLGSDNELTSLYVS